MLRTNLLAAGFAVALGTAVLLAGPGTPAPGTAGAGAEAQQEITLTITGEPGTLPRYAVPDFIALSPDAETVAAAQAIGQVLWDDLDFEREFDLIPRDTYAVDSGGAVAHRRAVRPVARARGRRPGDRDGPQTSAGDCPGRGAAVPGVLAAVGPREGVHRGARQPAAVRAHGRRRHPPEPGGAAGRGAHASWPSRPTATASGWAARSRSGR